MARNSWIRGAILPGLVIAGLFSSLAQGAIGPSASAAGGPRPGDAFIGQLPVVSTRCEPVYPEAARKKGIEGTVRVLALVGKDGRVKRTRIERSVPMLDRAAREAVRCWTFKPGMIDGQPAAVWLGVPVKFALH